MKEPLLQVSAFFTILRTHLLSHITCEISADQDFVMLAPKNLNSNSRKSRVLFLICADLSPITKLLSK